MLEFQLFRIKIYPSAQWELFSEVISRVDIVKKVIKSSPQAEIKTGSKWHIGNIAELDDSALYFRLGRTTKSTVEKYRDGNFIDEDFEISPYTHVIVDAELELVSIAKKPKLAPSPKSISNSFVRLLNKSQEALRIEATFEIEQIFDPEEFINQLVAAYKVPKFWVSFKRPNAFDVNQQFVQPMQRFLKESDGEKGKTELAGEAMKPDVLREIARSAASTGDNAGATIQAEEGGQKIKKTLKNNPSVIPFDDITEDDEKRNLLNRIRDLYSRIRYGEKQ